MKWHKSGHIFREMHLCMQYKYQLEIIPKSMVDGFRKLVGTKWDQVGNLFKKGGLNIMQSYAAPKKV